MRFLLRLNWTGWINYFFCFSFRLLRLSPFVFVVSDEHESLLWFIIAYWTGTQPPSTQTHAAPVCVCVCVCIVIMISIQPRPHTESARHTLIQKYFQMKAAYVCVFKPASLADWENRNISLRTHSSDYTCKYTNSGRHTHTLSSFNICKYFLKILIAAAEGITRLFVRMKKTS